MAKAAGIDRSPRCKHIVIVMRTGNQRPVCAASMRKREPLPHPWWTEMGVRPPLWCGEEIGMPGAQASFRLGGQRSEFENILAELSHVRHPTTLDQEAERWAEETKLSP